MADQATRSGQRYADPAIVAYVDDLHAACNPAQRIAFDAPELHAMPAIQLGLSEGKLLTLLMRMVGAGKVVEVGTLAGFSALRLAAGMPDDGVIWTFESDPRHAQVARENIRSAALRQRVEIVEGPASERLSSIEGEGPFDVVFLDADKESYPTYGRWAHRHLRSGGLLIADNAYLFGELLQDHVAGDAMRQFHEETARNFESVCVPTPDGMVIALRP